MTSSQWPTCACGCGEAVPAYTKSNHRKGIYVGQPRRFVGNHSNRGQHNPHYSGRDVMWKNGRAYVRLADGTWQRRNRYVMEQTLGRPLLPSEIVHHKDSDPANDAPDNLEVYESHHDHLMKHHYWSREDALAALQAAIDAIGHVPTASEYRQRCDQPTTKVFYRLFGSWLGALTALGRADEYRPRSSNQFIRKRQ